MFSTDDTIVAIATPPGRGGLGVIRLSGPDAAAVAARLVGRTTPFKPRHATLSRLASNAVGDQVIVTVFPAPHSYTGQHVAEISAHGSSVVLRAILGAAAECGARLAGPGEFTLRAFLNGKIDLVQAEAVADLVDAVTPLQARAAFDQLEGTLTEAIGQVEHALFDLTTRLEASLDFPDEGYQFVDQETARREIETACARLDELLAGVGRGRLIREGAQVAIVGTSNVGKSSVFNALLDADRAIVTATAGTTRDLLTERVDVGGIAVALVDTAGQRATRDEVEREGVARARRAGETADAIVLVLDRSRMLSEEDRRLIAATIGQPRVIAVNKTDLPAAWPTTDAPAEAAVEVSMKNRRGLDTLRTRMAELLTGARGPGRETPMVTNARHAALLGCARAALGRAGGALAASGDRLSEEFILADVQEGAAFLQEITGRRTTDDLLKQIFERFCIGK
ncbi:MAG: tRNA uridine-5-carboxymethylaminomethyl(34) synthesis GTPase MnmE [Acidobacteriota bacterium]